MLPFVVFVEKQSNRRVYFVSAIALAAVFCCFRAVLGSTLPIKTYTFSDGLSHDHVYRIVRDSRSFLWFCTGEGLSRFDGSEFKNYTTDDGLPHRAVTDLLETKAGVLWLATGDGLVLFDPKGRSDRDINDSSAGPMFRVFKTDDPDLRSKMWGVRDLIEDRDGVVWAAGNGGIYRIDTRDGINLRKVDITLGPSKNDLFQRLLQDDAGAIWAGTESGLYRILPDGRGVQAVEVRVRVESMMKDHAGRVWVGTGGGAPNDIGLRVYSVENDVPALVHDYRKKDGLSDDLWINAFLETSDGRTFVLVANGLCEYKPNEDPAKPQFQRIASQGLTDGLTDMVEDRNGDIWLATVASGALQIFRQGFVNYGREDGLISKDIVSIMEGTDGGTYMLGRGQTNIYRFNGTGFDVVEPRRMLAPSWGTGQLTFRDHLGAWWVAGASGLQRYPIVNSLGDLTRVDAERIYTAKDGLPTSEIFQLFEDSRGDIWITNMGSWTEGVSLWQRASDTIRRFTPADGLPPRDVPVAFAEDRGGNIWLGFYTGGISRSRNGRFESIAGAESSSTGWINNIFTDSAGRVWVSTSYRGIIRIDDPDSPGEPRLANLTTKEGLSSNQATCVTEDNFNRIYIGTARGVDRLDLRTGKIRAFSKRDGLPENFITQCSRDANGDLWFGSAHGLARYSPAADAPGEPPPIFLSDLRVNGERSRKLSELGETAVSGVELTSDQRQIQIEYFGLGFGTGEKIRFQYMFDGIDRAWSDPTEQRTVNLNLSSGNYRFLVRAVNADGVVSLQPASVSFSIARPIWQRWWFLLLLTIVLLLLIYAVYRYRLRRLIELERVRTRIATDLHDDIGSSLSTIAVLSEVIRQRSGDDAVNEPLNIIADTSREMVDSMSDIVWAINPDKDHLSDLVLRMRRFASDILDAGDIAYRFRVDEEHRDTTLGTDLRRAIYLIFKECVNNLVKHASATTAEISVSIQKRSLVVVIEDNGVGFDPAERAEPTDGLGGNGLVNVRRRAAEAGGSFAIDSRPGVGTTITIDLPIRDK